jgi:hypothetical protein
MAELKEIDSNNGTWVDEVVYLVRNIQSTVYIAISTILIIVLIGSYGYTETQEVVMFILGSNAGIITNNKSEK